MASATVNIWPRTIPMAHLLQPSIVEHAEVGVIMNESNKWITPIKEYLINDNLPNDSLEAKRLRYRVTRYLVLSGELYRRGYSRVL